MQSESINSASLTPPPSGISEKSKELIFPKVTGSSRAVSPAKIFPSLVKALGWQVSEVDSGMSTPVSLAKYDPDSQSWRTSGLSLFGGSIPYSGALPRSGTMRNGRIYAPPMSERPIDEKEFGLWPTPDCQNARDGAHFRKDNNIAEGGRHGVSLHHAVAMFPTPRKCDGEKGTRSMEGHLKERMRRRNGVDLPTAIRFPSPLASGKLNGGTRDFQHLLKMEMIGQITEEERRSMSAGNGGKLNPAWVEWLMGYSLGWTDLNASGIALSLRSPN